MDRIGSRPAGLDPPERLLGSLSRLARVEGVVGVQGGESAIPFSERLGKLVNIFPDAADPARRAELMARYVAKGKSWEEARALAAPLTKRAMGEHWIPRERIDALFSAAMERGQYRIASALAKFRDSPFNVLSGRIGSTGILPPPGAGGSAEELASFFRAMGPEELAKFRATGVLESHAQRLGLDAERGLWNWFKHSIKSSASPYKSMTTMPHIAEEWARKMGGQVVRITVPKSVVTKGFNVWQAEYLVPGGTRVLTFKVGTSLPLPSFGATAQWAAETTAVGVGAAGAGTGLGVLIDRALTPEHTEPTTEPGK